MAGSPLDPDEWEKVLGQMVRYHVNISAEIKELIFQIRKEMKEELVPVAEDKANYGKVVKQGVRAMWALEYEIQDLQVNFAKQLGSIDIENLTDDFVEDALLQSKPLQSVLKAIRTRQKEKMRELQKIYGEKISALEPLKIARPPKPEPKPDPPPAAEKKEGEGEGEKKAEEGAPAAEAAAPAAEAAAAPAAEEAPAVAAPAPVVDVPEPAIDASQQPAAVEASA